ncbi:MAG TPA: DUF4153 domain-containing protein [Caulobacteraceae bacterium]|jgi:hypothetical protein|nr:DUF4153 domain-containing protein [Caulobacteraceae bacterium]
MTEQVQGAGGASSRIGLARVAIGLAQGVALYGLHWAWIGKPSWPATEPVLYDGLLLATAFVPLIPLAGLAEMRRATLIVWTVAATVVAAGLGAYGALREAGGEPHQILSFPVVAFTAAFLFIANHLIAPADAERKPIASHLAYFDTTWKHGVQLVLSLLFVGAFWAALRLGGALFGLIGLKFLNELFDKDWFWIPVSFVVFAAAVHLADVRAGLTRGIRTVGLTLLSWLMPIMGLLAFGFLVALLFTGLAPLWKLGRSTAILLSAAAVLVVLINAAYQDGQADTRAPLVLRWAGRITALLITPLLMIAAVGLWIRIGQHGLTPDRIIAIACVIVGACYALGYGIAAVLPGAWMKPLERTNVLTALVILVVILALFTPIADPARISTDDQVTRLEAGRIALDKFDFEFLRFKAGHYGRDALKRLANRTTGPNAAAIAQRAKDALTEKNRWDRTHTPLKPVDQIKVYPEGRKLPDSFLKQDWSTTPLCEGGFGDCEAYLVDANGDSKTEVLLYNGIFANLFAQGADGSWKPAGSYEVFCANVRDALRAGKYAFVPSVSRDLEIGGVRYAYRNYFGPRACAPPKK